MSHNRRYKQQAIALMRRRYDLPDAVSDERIWNTLAAQGLALSFAAWDLREAIRSSLPRSLQWMVPRSPPPGHSDLGGRSEDAEID